MPLVEFIYDSDCPNARRARTQLLRAFAETGVSATWQEWEQSGSNNPYHVKRFGSPTILVDGKDVTAAEPGDGLASCLISILDMNDSEVDERAKRLGIRSVPAVEINGKLAGCCAGRGPDEDTLRRAMCPPDN